MFIGKKIYCRVSQFIFWLAIPFLPYSDPLILDSSTDLPAELKRRGIGSVVIVTDRAIHGFGLIEPLKKALERQGIAYAVYDETVPNPTVENVEAALITDGQTRHKFPINDLMLIPKVSVLDPEVTRSLPKAITASTGMDALTYAVEAYIGRSTVKSTRADALEAVRLISQNLLDAYRDGDDLNARKNMLMGSFLAGRAFAKSYVGYCHAVAHSLGGKYDLPHGLANAVLLPYVLDAYGSTVHKKLKRLGIAAGVCDATMDDAAAASAFIAWIRQMNRDMGIPTKLKGIRREDIPELARKADKEGNPFYPVPKLFDAEELQQFYYDVLED